MVFSPMWRFCTVPCQCWGFVDIAVRAAQRAPRARESTYPNRRQNTAVLQGFLAEARASRTCRLHVWGGAIQPRERRAYRSSAGPVPNVLLSRESTTLMNEAASGEYEVRLAAEEALWNSSGERPQTRLEHRGIDSGLAG
jgi:hypothetical protein